MFSAYGLFFFAAELLRDMCRVTQSEMNCQTDNCSFSSFMRAFSLRVNVECGKATNIKSYVLLLSGTSVFDFKMDEVKMFGQLCIFFCRVEKLNRQVFYYEVMGD